MLFDTVRREQREQAVSATRRPTAVTWRLIRQACHRLGWGVADQAMSSLSNFAVNIYIARTLGAVQYGAFALAFVTYGFALNASRGLATDPLLVRCSGTDIPTWRRAVTKCTGTATTVGLTTGAIILAAAALLSGTTRLAFLALGLTMPGLMLQDSWRFSFFALGRGRQAFLNDTVWTVVLIPALVLLRETGHADVFWFVFAWGAAAAVAAAIGPLQARTAPRLSGAWEWLSRHRDLGPRYLAEGTVNNAASQLRNYGVGFILGLAAVGYVQAATTLMGPFMVIFFGMGLVTLPEAVRVLRRSPRHLAALLPAGQRRPRNHGAGLGNHPPGGATERTRAPDARRPLETDLSAGVADHDIRPRHLFQFRCRHGPARLGSRAAEPARHGHPDGGDCRFQRRGSCRWRGSRDHGRPCRRVMDRRSDLLAATSHGAAGIRQHASLEPCPSPRPARRHPK